MHPHLVFLFANLHLLLAQTPDSPVVNTPTSVVQCLPTLLTFHGGAPPYTLSAIPAGQVGAAPLVELGTQSGDSYTWVTNLPGGTAITLQIRDSRGVINYSQAVTVQPSSDSKCLTSGGGPAPSNPPNGPPNPPTTPPAAGTATAPPKPGNNTAAPPANTTSSAATPNTTAPTNGSASSPPKGSSPFVPPASTSTPVNSNPSNAASNAPASAAASVSDLCQQAFLAGLAVAASLSALFA